jgi:6-phospho-beta-glucosidase
LRTIPVILDIAREMRELAPGALLINFTNPSGLVAEAVINHAPDVPVVGVCNSPITAKMGFLGLLAALSSVYRSVDPDQVELSTLGLNHLSWHRGMRIHGQDVWPLVIEAYIAGLKKAPVPEWDPNTVESLRMIPNSYLQYYYHTKRKLAEQENWPPSRAEKVMEIEKALLRQYAEKDRIEPPADLMKRGGAYYSTVATKIMNSHFNDLGETYVVSARQGNAVPGWRADWVLELPCSIDSSGAHPLPSEPLPLACFGLLAQVKAYELLTSQAAVQGDRNAAYQALLVHPLGPSEDHIQELLDDMLETNRNLLPRFWP